MFTRTLTSLSSALPSALKYQLGWAKTLYSKLLTWRQPPVVIHTPHTSFKWQIDALTCQRHLRGTYEPELQKHLADRIEPGMVAWDVGAHVGFFSLFMASLGARVIAFEPNPISRASLERQIDLNGFDIQVYPYALSDSEREVNIDFSQDSMTKIGEGRTLVKTKRLDSIMLPSPDVIKIDVEGHESKVLHGALPYLERSRPTIFCDWDNENTESELNEVLGWLGYTISRDGRLFICEP